MYNVWNMKCVVLLLFLVIPQHCTCAIYFYRFGQLLSSLLPRDHSEENKISLYEGSRETEQEKGTTSSSLDDQDVTKQRKQIRLRNLLLDVLMSHFTTEHNEFDTK